MDVEKVTEVAPEVDDDGRVRTGTVWTATTHAITAVIGSGVLALPWSVAQMGWVLGPIALIGCAYITYYTAVLLSDCYRSPDPVHGKRNYTYMDAVRSCLGPREVAVCGIAQYTILCGAIVGYTITAATGIITFLALRVQVRGAQQLPPLQGPRRGLQPGRDDVPGHVRRNRDRPVAAAEPGEGHIRLHRRRRHVLHLLLRRALPQRRQVRVQSQGLRHHLWQPYRRPRRRLRGDQDLELPSGPRQHRLRLHLRHAPHRDPGHGEGAAVGERDDEEGEPVRHRRDDGLLRVAGVHRVRGVRQRGAGEHPHRLRRAVLACGPRQHRRGRPPGRGLPGVRAARVRVLREEAPGPVPGRGLLPPGARAAAAGPPGRAAVHHVQAGAAHGVRGRHDGGVAYAALLQRHPRPARRRRLLAAHRLLPGHHVHHAGQGAARQRQVGGAAGAQRRRARRVAARRGGLRGRHRPAPRARHHVQDPAVIDRWTWPV